MNRVGKKQIVWYFSEKTLVLKNTLLLCAIALVLPLSSCAPVKAARPLTKASSPGSGYQASPETLDPSKLVDLVNAYRTKGCNCGGVAMPPVGAVRWSDVLASAAQVHSNDMAKKDFFSHRGSAGTTAGDRIQKQGYSYKTYGENIGKGYPDEKAVVEGWIKSPGHCKNIMNGAFKEMGVAVNGAYWTQVLATQR